MYIHRYLLFAIPNVKGRAIYRFNMKKNIQLAENKGLFRKSVSYSERSCWGIFSEVGRKYPILKWEI